MMIASREENERMYHLLSKIIPPDPKESYLRMINFSKTPHSTQEWRDEFFSMGARFGSHETVAFLIFKNMVEANTIPAEHQLPILIDIYIMKRVEKSFGRLLTKVVRTEPPEVKELRKQRLREELADFIDENDCITVYRGEYINAFNEKGRCSRPIHLAASFTLKHERAEFFAKRFHPEIAKIYTLHIPFDKVAWYTDEREEAEIIVPPLGKGYIKYLINVEERHKEEQQ